MTPEERNGNIAIGVIAALIAWGIGSCVADNNTFNESRQHWDRCHAWGVKFQNPYPGNYVAPSAGNLKWYEENC